MEINKLRRGLARRNFLLAQWTFGKLTRLTWPLYVHRASTMGEVRFLAQERPFDPWSYALVRSYQVVFWIVSYPALYTTWLSRRYFVRAMKLDMRVRSLDDRNGS